MGENKHILCDDKKILHRLRGVAIPLISQDGFGHCGKCIWQFGDFSNSMTK